MKGQAGALALILVVAGACATPAPPAPAPAAAPTRDDLYVLLPAQDGKTGALSVTHEGHTRTLSAPHAAVRVREVGRLEVGAASDDEVKQAFGEALAAQPPRPASFLLYFLEGRDELTPDSALVVQRIFAEIARRPAPEIVVIGHTDRVGGIAYNDALSLRRAEKVRDDLVKQGIPREQIEVAGRGEREPLVPTDDEMPEPRNRRVEVSVR